MPMQPYLTPKYWMHSNQFFLFMSIFLLDIQYYYFLIHKEISIQIILAIKLKLFSSTPHFFSLTLGFPICFFPLFSLCI